jgi:hypothetical protein
MVKQGASAATSVLTSGISSPTVMPGVAMLTYRRGWRVYTWVRGSPAMVSGGSMFWQAHRKLSWSAYVQLSMVKSVGRVVEYSGGMFRASMSVVEYVGVWSSSAVVRQARDRSPSQLQTFVVGASNNCQKAANLGSELHPARH